MKVYAGVIVYNEEVFIEASLKSLYNHVDEIIVVDGSRWGPSTDKTAKIAQSVGPKVKLISGTFRNPKDADHKKIQRQVYIDNMEKSHNNWCILHDADEVWDDENIARLVDHLRYADRKTMLFSYQWLHFFGDCWHYIHGGAWSEPRSVGTFRLVPGMRQLNHHRVGIPETGHGFGALSAPGSIVLNDVMFYHCGQAATKEKLEFKTHYYFVRDSFFKRGYKPDQWEKYRKEVFLPDWEKRMEQPNVKPYDGPYPKYIQPLIGTFWKKK